MHSTVADKSLTPLWNVSLLFLRFCHKKQVSEDPEEIILCSFRKINRLFRLKAIGESSSPSSVFPNNLQPSA